MPKIASNHEFQTELHKILAQCQGEERPSRETIAAELSALADRVADEPTFKKGQKAKYRGQDVEVVEVAKNGKVTIRSSGGAIKTFKPDEAEKQLKTAAGMTLDQGEKLMWDLTQDSKKLVDQIQSLRGRVLREKKNKDSEDAGFWDEMDKALKKAETHAHGTHRGLREYS